MAWRGPSLLHIEDFADVLDKIKFPASLSGRGPRMLSTETTCIGYPVLMVCRGARFLVGAVLRVAQVTQVRH